MWSELQATTAVVSLAAVFESLSLGKYLAAFEAEEYLVSDLPNIDKEQMAKLIPAGGPRSRLEKWIKDQQPARPTATPAAASGNRARKLTCDHSYDGFPQQQRLRQVIWM